LLLVSSKKYNENGNIVKCDYSLQFKIAFSTLIYSCDAKAAFSASLIQCHIMFKATAFISKYCVINFTFTLLHKCLRTE